MALGVEINEMGWDLLLRAQSRRALAMNSVWLREEGERKLNGNREDSYMIGNTLWVVGNKKPGYGQPFDPVLGFNLEGKSAFLNHSGEKLLTDKALTDIEYDLEEGVLIREEGKKRARGEMEKPIEMREINTSAVRNRRLLEINHLSLVAATVRRNENLKLEYPWIRESTDSLKTSAYAEDTNPQMVFFMEKKLCKSQMERVWYSCGYVNGIEVDPEGTRGGLCLAWRNEICVMLRNYSKRHINLMVDDNKVRDKWRFTSFYGSPYIQDKDIYWPTLRNLYTGKETHWFVCGDFNEIIYGFEKNRGLPRDERRMKIFHNVLADCQLMDMGFSGNWFTWKRGNLPETNIRERLDKGVANEEWMAMFPKEGLQKWASRIRIDRRRRKEFFIARLSELIEAERDDFNLAEMIDTKIQLNFEIEKDEHYWEQRARVNWLKFRGRNTTFFHSQATQRQRRNFIHKLTDEEGKETKIIQEMEDASQMRIIKDLRYYTQGRRLEKQCLKWDPQKLQENIDFRLYFIKIVVNGYTGEKFQPTRGLRQGDPLSSFLYLICEEDDCILFSEATSRRATLLKGILREYRICSGQCVNFEKSTPKKRIDNWSTRHLSQGGNEEFIKAILQAIPTYTIAYFLLPKSLCAELESISAKFWWQKGNTLVCVEEPLKLTFTYLKECLGCKGLATEWTVLKSWKGARITVWDDSWIPRNDTDEWSNRNDNEGTPLTETSYDDFQVWKGEPSGEFSVRICPRCGNEEEDNTHIFRQCLITSEVWKMLDLSWVINSTIQSFGIGLPVSSREVLLNNVEYSIVDCGSSGARGINSFIKGSERQGESYHKKLKDIWPNLKKFQIDIGSGGLGPVGGTPGNEDCIEHKRSIAICSKSLCRTIGSKARNLNGSPLNNNNGGLRYSYQEMAINETR
ncbi:hypothetical protein CXB51_031263 [Gossypium anomalum]|uniref:Reverse transcriptase n=1 Tax=Gossypium anomalum TaxID=47600 RepID=A0A8J5Y6T7_9ROSI|nr:hypothetical protein CXB51_031263 [Gossypium anomalum]